MYIKEVWIKTKSVNSNEFGVSRCKLLYRERINNEVLLYSTRSYSQYPVINHDGKEYETECIYMYNWITLLYCRNQHNIVNQLYFNKINFKIGEFNTFIYTHIHTQRHASLTGIILKKELVGKKEMLPLSFYPLKETTIQQKWKRVVQVIGRQTLSMNPRYIDEFTSLTHGGLLKGLELHQGKAPVWHKGAWTSGIEKHGQSPGRKERDAVTKTIVLVIVNLSSLGLPLRSFSTYAIFSKGWLGFFFVLFFTFYLFLIGR